MVLKTRETYSGYCTAALCKKTNSGKFELGSDLGVCRMASGALSRPSVIRPLTYDLRDACGRAVSLPAVDAYAQSRRLQPVLRTSETARHLRVCRTCACLGCVCSQSFSTEAQRHREKPGIEEQHNPCLGLREAVETSDDTTLPFTQNIRAP